MTKKDFMALAERNGIEVEYDAGRKSHPRTGEPVPWSITLDSPPGKIFNGSWCHVDCGMSGEGDVIETAPDWAREIKTLEAIIAEGFSDCDDPECDTCHPEVLGP